MTKRMLTLLTLALSVALFADVTAVGRTRNGYPLIIPQPQKLEPAEGSFTLPAELTVAAPKEFDFAPLAKDYAKTVKGGKVVPAGSGKALCRFELTTQGVPASVEGYTLAVAPGGITVKARDVRGLFYGMQSLKWMLRNREGKALKACRITDWPDLELRALFWELPKISPSKVDRLCRVIEVLAELKYNAILSEFADNFPMPGSPFTGRKETFSREDIEKIKAAAKRNHVALVPKLQVVSHAQWITSHRDWNKLTEGKVKTLWRSLYCLSNPEAQKVVEDLIRETTDVIKPRYFHIGLDEIIQCGFPICPKCRSQNLTELMLKHLRPIKKILNDRGVTPIIYQDEFFNTMPRAVPSRGKPMADFPEKFGRDVVVNSWEYGDNPSPQIGNAIRKRGFKDLLYMSYSIHRDNPWRLPQMAQRLKAMGTILAFWYSAPATLDNPEKCNFYTYHSVVAQGNYSWNAGDVDYSRLPADTTAILRELLNGRPFAFRGKAAAVPISGVFNQALGSDPQFPIFDAALADKVKRIAAADQAKFDVAVRDGKVLATVLAGTPDDGYPMKPVTIPIGTRASGAAFLMCASFYNSFSIAKDSTMVKIGQLKIVYETGKPEIVPLTLRHNINDWNTYVGGTRSRSVLRGNDVKGSLFTLYSVEWRNPRPKSVIKSIVFSSNTKSTIASALFALSLSDAEAAPTGAPAPAPAIFAAPNRKPEAERKPFISFANGMPAGAKSNATSIKGFRCQVVDDPEKGKVLEFTIPETVKQPARCYIDIPVRNAKDFKFFIFDLKTDDFSGVSRPDVYWMVAAPKNQPSRAIAALNYTLGIGINEGVWNTICLPRDRFREKEHGGLEIPEATVIRVGFFLRSPIRPTKIRISGFTLADEPVGGRVNVKLPAL